MLRVRNGLVKVYLKQGSVVTAVFDENDYFEIYDSWKNGSRYVTFSNCEFLGEQIIGIEWDI